MSMSSDFTTVSIRTFPLTPDFLISKKEIQKANPLCLMLVAMKSKKTHLFGELSHLPREQHHHLEEPPEVIDLITRFLTPTDGSRSPTMMKLALLSKTYFSVVFSWDRMQIMRMHQLPFCTLQITCPKEMESLRVTSKEEMVRLTATLWRMPLRAQVTEYLDAKNLADFIYIENIKKRHQFKKEIQFYDRVFNAFVWPATVLSMGWGVPVVLGGVLFGMFTAAFGGMAVTYVIAIAVAALRALAYLAFNMGQAYDPFSETNHLFADIMKEMLSSFKEVCTDPLLLTVIKVSLIAAAIGLAYLALGSVYHWIRKPHEITTKIKKDDVKIKNDEYESYMGQLHGYLQGKLNKMMEGTTPSEADPFKAKLIYSLARHSVERYQFSRRVIHSRQLSALVEECLDPDFEAKFKSFLPALVSDKEQLKDSMIKRDHEEELTIKSFYNFFITTIAPQLPGKNPEDKLLIYLEDVEQRQSQASSTHPSAGKMNDENDAKHIAAGATPASRQNKTLEWFTPGRIWDLRVLILRNKYFDDTLEIMIKRMEPYCRHLRTAVVIGENDEKHLNSQSLSFPIIRRNQGTVHSKGEQDAFQKYADRFQIRLLPPHLNDRFSFISLQVDAYSMKVFFTIVSKEEPPPLKVIRTGEDRAKETIRKLDVSIAMVLKHLFDQGRISDSEGMQQARLFHRMLQALLQKVVYANRGCYLGSAK